MSKIKNIALALMAAATLSLAVLACAETERSIEPTDTPAATFDRSAVLSDVPAETQNESEDRIQLHQEYADRFVDAPISEARRAVSAVTSAAHESAEGNDEERCAAAYDEAVLAASAMGYTETPSDAYIGAYGNYRSAKVPPIVGWSINAARAGTHTADALEDLGCVAEGGHRAVEMDATEDIEYLRGVVLERNTQDIQSAIAKHQRAAQATAVANVTQEAQQTRSAQERQQAKAAAVVATQVAEQNAQATKVAIAEAEYAAAEATREVVEATRAAEQEQEWREAAMLEHAQRAMEKLNGLNGAEFGRRVTGLLNDYAALPGADGSNAESVAVFQDRMNEFHHYCRYEAVTQDHKDHIRMYRPEYYEIIRAAKSARDRSSYTWFKESYPPDTKQEVLDAAEHHADLVALTEWRTAMDEGVEHLNTMKRGMARRAAAYRLMREYGSRATEGWQFVMNATSEVLAAAEAGDTEGVIAASVRGAWLYWQFANYAHQVCGMTDHPAPGWWRLE